LGDKTDAFKLLIMAITREPKRLLKRNTWSLLREIIGI